MNPKESKNSIQVIERMMRLLDVLAEAPNAVSLKIAAGKAGLHPSTAHRILGALVRDRMVERVDQGSYRLGMRLLELGNLVKSRISVREHLEQPHHAVDHLDRALRFVPGRGHRHRAL